jgi:branched-chain amino acid aminotransferase
MTDVTLIDGTPADSLPLTDLAILRGYGVFDFTRTYNRRPWRLRDHIRRLFVSAQAIDLVLPWTVAEVMAQVETAIAASHHADCFVRIIATGGDGVNSILPAGRPRLVICVTAVTAYPPAYYDAGIKLVTVQTPRYLPGVKCLNYIPAVRAQKQAAAQDAVEAIYVDQDRVYEGTSTNLFIVAQGQVITPTLEGVLHGITRDDVMGLTAVSERPLTRAELDAADEVFITSSSKGVMPVRAVDDVVYTAPGPHTTQIMTAFERLTGVALYAGS